MSDAQIFWLALIGSTAWSASARTYRGKDAWSRGIRTFDELAGRIALIVAMVFLVRSFL